MYFNYFRSAVIEIMYFNSGNQNKAACFHTNLQGKLVFSTEYNNIETFCDKKKRYF